MSAKKKTGSPPQILVNGCNFTFEPSVINDNLLAAIRCVAEAATANAKAIEHIADRLWGPNDNRTCITFNGSEQVK